MLSAFFTTTIPKRMTVESRATLDSSQEKPLQPINGYAMLATVMITFLFAIGLFFGGAVALEGRERIYGGAGMVAAVLLFVLTLIACGGFFILLPNEACVLTLFGSYT